VQFISVVASWRTRPFHFVWSSLWFVLVRPALDIPSPLVCGSATLNSGRSHSLIVESLCIFHFTFVAAVNLRSSLSSCPMASRALDLLVLVLPVFPSPLIHAALCFKPLVRPLVTRVPSARDLAQALGCPVRRDVTPSCYASTALQTMTCVSLLRTDAYLFAICTPIFAFLASLLRCGHHCNASFNKPASLHPLREKCRLTTLVMQ